jgi:hypothetical protein
LGIYFFFVQKKYQVEGRKGWKLEIYFLVNKKHISLFYGKQD